MKSRDAEFGLQDSPEFQAVIGLFQQVILRARPHAQALCNSRDLRIGHRGLRSEPPVDLQKHNISRDSLITPWSRASGGANRNATTKALLGYVY